MDIRNDGNRTSPVSGHLDPEGTDEGPDSASSDDGYFERMETDLRPNWRAQEIRQPSSGWRGQLRRLFGLAGHLKSLSTSGQADYRSVGGSDKGRLAMMVASLKELLFSSKLNLLICFVPAGVATYFTGCPPPWVFTTNAIAIVPLSALLTDATERIAADAGDTIGALLNISLGNLVELILFVALANGHVRIVESSILGSILVNILLILGSALLACSLIGAETLYNAAGTQILGSLLFVSVFVFLMPTAFQFAYRHHDGTNKATLMMSRITACVVLAIYVLYVFHELKSPRIARHSKVQQEDPESNTIIHEAPLHSGHQAEPAAATVLPPRTIRFADDDDDADEGNEGDAKADESGDHDQRHATTAHESNDDRGRPSLPGRTRSGSVYRPGFVSRGHSRSLSVGSGNDSVSVGMSRDSSMVSGVSGGRASLIRTPLPTMRAIRSSCDDFGPVVIDTTPVRSRSIDRAVSIWVLIVSSALMSMNAEFLVSTIDQITHEGHLSEAMIGLIILPIVGNMAEYITVVTVAVRDKLDLAIAVSVGSSIQIALCVAPLTVLAGWVLDKDLLLTFNFFEMATLIGTVLLVNIIILSEGTGASTSNALRGGLICGCYAIIGIGAFLAPD